MSQAVPPGAARGPRLPFDLDARRLVAPFLALVGLVILAWLTLGLLTGQLGLPSSGSGKGPGVVATPAPSNVVVVDPRVDVPGAIVYVKAGNVWIQSGKEAHQLTSAGQASMPSWSPDGAWVYYIETTDEIGLYPAQGDARRYAMTVPNVKRIRADGSGKPELVATGRFRQGRYTWFYWLREPVMSPDGRTIALISDAPNPLQSDVVIQFLDLQSKKLTKPRLADTAGLGHQDPAWSPDGKQLLYVRNDRDAARGAPVIYRYDVHTKKAAALSGQGYLSPSWSRDGRFVAATRTDSFGTDVVILDAQKGTELIRLTDDGRSWSPVWSPKGDAVAYLHLESGIVDLRMVPLTGTAPNWTAGDTVNLTELSGLDGASRPGWFIPPDQLPPLPTATPALTPPAVPTGSASPGPSAP
jgi:dipeptidyl aminopeptidase/acylaminoacyl peptidase